MRLLLDQAIEAARAGPQEAAAAHKYPVFLASGNPYNAAVEHSSAKPFPVRIDLRDGDG
jgi:hypothetical protein